MGFDSSAASRSDLTEVITAGVVESLRKAAVREELQAVRYELPAVQTETLGQVVRSELHPKLDFKKHGNGTHPPICFLFKCVS
jgi:hypothetical protein